MPLLDLMVKAKAFTIMDTLVQNDLWTPELSAGHGKIGDLISDPVFGMPREHHLSRRSIIRGTFLQAFPAGRNDCNSDERASAISPRVHITACEWVKKRHEERWNSYEGGAYTKHFFRRPDAKWTRDLLSMDPSCIARVVWTRRGGKGHTPDMRLPKV